MREGDASIVYDGSSWVPKVIYDGAWQVLYVIYDGTSQVLYVIYDGTWQVLYVIYDGTSQALYVIYFAPRRCFKTLDQSAMSLMAKMSFVVITLRNSELFGSDLCLLTTNNKK